MDTMSVVGLIAWPLIVAVLLLFFIKKPSWAQWLNLIAHFPWVFLFLHVWFLSESSLYSNRIFPVMVSFPGMAIFKSSVSLGIDGLNLPLIGLQVFLSLILALYSMGKEKLGAGYLALFSVLNATSVGSLMAEDALLFYLFWEFMLIPMYLLIGIWGSKKRAYAAIKFFSFTLFGSLFMLAAIVALMFRGDLNSLSWHDIAALNLVFDSWTSLPALLFFGFLIAFLVKIPAWPLHVWLPDAHTEAPTGASVILAGVLLKLGVYGIARWCLALFPQVALQVEVVYTMIALGLIGIVLGSFSAWQQKDIKRMIAYSSVAHLGFMIIGLFSFQLSSVQGAFFQNIAHGLSTGSLFLIFGMIYDRTHTRELSDYSGLAKAHPWLATAFVVAALASMGLPGLPGFVGEFLILSGLFFSQPWLALVALSGVLLGAAYMLKLVREFVFGDISPCLSHHPINLRWSEKAALIPIIGLLVYLGLGGQFLLQKVALPISTLLLNMR
jgi:NADH-quinone oxidoreductase subunit M